MEEVIFYLGLSSKYDISKHGSGVYFTTDAPHKIIVNGDSYGSVDVDDKLTETGTNPVAGHAIYNAIKDEVKANIAEKKYGKSIELETYGVNTYILHLKDENGEIISSTKAFMGEQDEYADPSGIRFNVINNELVKINLPVSITVIFDVLDKSGDSMGKSGLFTLVRDSETNDPIYSLELQPGQTVIDITEYIKEGELTKFWAYVTAETSEGEKRELKYFDILSVNLSINTSYDISKTTTIGNIIEIPIEVKSIKADKYVEVYLNGNKVSLENDGLFTSAEGIFNVKIPTTSLNHGTHNILIRALYKIEETNTTVYSNIIYLDLIVISESITTPAFACRFDYENGDTLISGTPILKAVQYDTFKFLYFVWSNENNREVSFYSLGEHINDDILNNNISLIEYKYNTGGIKSCYLLYQGYKYEFSVDVLKSPYLVNNNTQGLLLYLDAYGKSNNSSLRDNWSYNNINSVFENFTWSGDGWSGNSLKLFNGNKVTINHKPFSLTDTGALTMSFCFKVSNIIDPNEVIISCADNEGYGLTITPQEATFKTKNGTLVTKYSENKIYNIGLVIFPKATENSLSVVKNNNLMCYLYVNGIISKGLQKSDKSSTFQDIPQNIILLANKCELEVYSIRSYSLAYGDDEMFDNYLIDLGDSNKLASEFELNDIINNNSLIDINKVYGKIPYFVITGVNEEHPEYTLVDYISMIEDKDTKYPVSSILYVDDKDSSFNFIALPKAEAGEVLTNSNSPTIRCLGTSSMKYPRKNYRIYTNKSKLYLGCDNNGKNGVLQEEPVYSMTSSSIPVDCWCLKADYAESSSSHNTGTASLVEEVFRKAGLLTPALKYQSSDYPYLVRTTVEGKPCLVFHRKTETDTPVFIGKYNFNNDKSTENVFGFLNIPGYHNNSSFEEERNQQPSNLVFPEGFEDVYYKEVDGKIVLTTKDDSLAEVATKEDILKIYKNNPTECWEFLTNATEMGNFIKSNFNEKAPNSDNLYWLTTWESRFPDEDELIAALLAGVKPYYLMTVANWINSTDANLATGDLLPEPKYGYTNDTEEYRLAKFKNELKYYFDVSYLCAYYMITECLAAADQRVKNMMWGFWYNPDADNHVDQENNPIMGKVRCYPIFYDNDTILGLDNTGVLSINWDADENTVNENGSYVFAGHESVLWNNLRSLFDINNEAAQPSLEKTYKQIRLYMTNKNMLSYYNTNQSDKYSERVYNKDSLYKYVIPYNIGIPYTSSESITTFDVIAKMDGSREAHRTWFIENRMSKYDAKYNTGDYTSSYIHFKGHNEEQNLNYSISLKTDRDWYCTFVNTEGTSTIIKHTQTQKDKEVKIELAPGSIIKEGTPYNLRGSKWIKELDLSKWGSHKEFDIIGTMPVLEKLILADENTKAYSALNKLSFNNTPALKYLDVNYVPLTSLNLQKCKNIETLKATHTQLPSVEFAEGSSLLRLELPSTFNKLSLIGATKLENKNIILDDPKNLTSLRLERTDSLNAIELLNNILLLEGNKLKNVRITDLELSGDGSDLLKYIQSGLKGIDENGNNIEKCTLIGTYKLSRLWNDLYSEKTLQEVREYFPLLEIIEPEYTAILIDIKLPEIVITNIENNTKGKDYSPSGHIKNILDLRYSCLVKESGDFEVTVAKLSNNNSNYYMGDEIESSLNGTQGDYCMYEPYYCYKGINDYINQKMYVFFSSFKKENLKRHNEVRVKLTDCVEYKNKLVNVRGTDQESFLINNDSSSTATYLTYSYEIPLGYKQIRVNTVASSIYGAVIVNQYGEVKTSLSATSDKGMHNASYLFTNLPDDAYKIFFTIDNKYPLDYCVYLTDSLDKEAIEPDWVEHKECFVGRVIGTMLDGRLRSAIVPAMLFEVSNYYSPNNSESVSKVCKDIETFKGYYAADYEVMKDIIILSYAAKGEVGLHNKLVGASFVPNNPYNARRAVYYPNDVNWTKFGIEDTVTNGDYIPAYYDLQSDNYIYPGVSTLLGYHLFISRGSITSSNDQVKNNIYHSIRTGRNIILQSSTGRIGFHILGGRYMDIFPATNDANNDLNNIERFCGKYSSPSSTDTQYLSLGEFNSNSNSHVPNAYTISFVSTTTKQQVGLMDLSNLQRLLIIPNKINITSDIEHFKNL